MVVKNENTQKKFAAGAHGACVSGCVMLRVNYVAAFLEQYSDITATMTIPDSATSTSFPYESGLRQGDPESASHFDEAMDFILCPLASSWSESGLAFVLPDTACPITHIRFADNVYIFTRAIAAAETMLSTL